MAEKGNKTRISRQGDSTARRLNDASPSLYRAMAPAARYLRRALALSLESTQNAVARLDTAGLHPATRPQIVLDGCVFQLPFEGIARVWRELLAEWSRSGFAEHIIILDRADSAPRLLGYRYLAVPPVRARDSKSQRAFLERVCRLLSADLFISTLYTYPDHAPSLLLVHDLTPEVLGWDPSQPEWREVRASIDRASAYMCVSRSTERDLHRLHPESRGKPSVVAHNGIARSFRPTTEAEASALRERLGLPKRFFVFVGHRDGHKNGQLVFDALSRVPDASDIGLLCIGGAPVLEQRYVTLAGNATVRVARLSDDDLKAAYTGAAALLYPSRYEGFGLPILEAMSCGCPVITADNSSLPEVAGDAAIYVGVDDSAGLLRAMEDVVDPGTRSELVRRGFAQAARFDWTSTAATIRTAIERAANS